MQQVYTSTTKVLVDSRQGGNMLYLPLDKIMQANTHGAAADAASSATTAPPVPPAAPVTPAPDTRGRDGRSRDRDVR